MEVTEFGQGEQRVAIMQPYLFPYIGYFQLAAAVDAFWLFDCVNFTRRSWMNRNNILVNKNRFQFTVPVSYGSQDQKISQKRFAPDAPVAVDKLIKTFSHAYKKAGHVDDAKHLLFRFSEALMRPGNREHNEGSDFTSVVEGTLRDVFAALGIVRPIYRTSTLRLDDSLKASDRIIAACQAIGAREYVNMFGGRALYNVGDFNSAGIALYFLTQNLHPYTQIFNVPFEPGLSVLDVIACNDVDERAQMLAMAKLEKA